MKNLSTLLIAIAVVGVLGLGVFALGQNAPTPKPQAVSSPDIPSPYLNWGGVRVWQSAMKPKAASYIVCSLQSPASTSTLQYSGVRLSVSTTSAMTWFITKAATATATTTLLANLTAVSANNQLTLIASSSPIASQADMSQLVFAPNTFVNIGAFGETGGITRFAPQGVCQATWIELADL